MHSSHRSRGAGLLLAAIALLAVVAMPAQARADTVTDWNKHATDALIVTAGQAPPVAVVHLAMVHGAVYDAVNAIDGRYEPYLGAPPARRSWSKDAAAAAAAHRVLATIVPAQQATLGAHYAASLASIDPGKARDRGVAVGEAAAEAMLAARQGDGRMGPYRFPIGSAPGEWRPPLPPFVNDPNAWLGQLKPFLIDDPADFRSEGPNPLTSEEYAEEFEEVKSIGSADSTTRTDEQTAISRFWGERPAATWSEVFRQLAGTHDLETADSARFYATLYLTAADASIVCWADKARWLFWRPITAIREAATDDNPETHPDPHWVPLLNNPPYPDHPSGLTCFSNSVLRTLRDFFDTNRTAFTASSPNLPTTRAFTRLSDAIDEIIDARVWSGIHFRIADEHGALLGRRVAEWREEHALGRADEDDDEEDEDDDD